MGTTVECLLEAPPSPARWARLAGIEREFARLEALLSRFRPDSELSQLNRAGGGCVSEDLFDVVELALAAREQTGGRFDPTVHDALLACGYDRSFDALEPAAADGPAPRARCGGAVALDRARRRITLEPGAALDLGGIAKGYAVDRAVALLGELGPCLVNAGGDLAARERTQGAVWPVGVDLPDRLLTLELATGAVATTGRDRRRWQRGGREQHHLIDPFAGRPAHGSVLRVTVGGHSAVEAEVLAKRLFLSGSPECARSEADALGVPAVIVSRAGAIAFAGGLA